MSQTFNKRRKKKTKQKRNGKNLAERDDDLYMFSLMLHLLNLCKMCSDSTDSDIREYYTTIETLDPRELTGQKFSQKLLDTKTTLSPLFEKDQLNRHEIMLAIGPLIITNKN